MDQDQQNAANMTPSGAEYFEIDVTQLPQPSEEILFAGIQFPFPPTPRAPNAPVEYTHKVFRRVFLATKYIFGEKIRAMAQPIIDYGVQIHEAHCYGLGAFREVEQYEFDEADTDIHHLVHEARIRYPADPNIRAMIRYSAMLILFGHLSNNGATGRGIADGRSFTLRFTDSRIHDEEFAILHAHGKIVHDKKNNVMVKMKVEPTNWTNKPPILTHTNTCTCLDPGVNHFFYVADHLWTKVRPGICRMPENPAFLLTRDFVTDEKHIQGCKEITPNRLVLPNLGIQQAGAFVLSPPPVPWFMKDPNGYLKFCLDGTYPTMVDITAMLLELLPCSGALYIRKDLLPHAVLGFHYI